MCTCCVVWVMWPITLSFSEKLPSSDGNKGWFIEIGIQNDPRTGHASGEQVFTFKDALKFSLKVYGEYEPVFR